MYQQPSTSEESSLLLQRRSLLVELLMEEINTTPSSQKSRNRRQKRFLKSSTFWEEDWNHMPDDQFVLFYRISRDTFEEIFEKVLPSLITTSAIGDSIGLAKKLELTLRYLATGDDFMTLAHLFRVGASIVRAIIKDVTGAIATIPFFKSLVEFPSTEEDYFKIAKDFFDMFLFPDCVGAVDDTHIKI